MMGEPPSNEINRHIILKSGHFMQWCPDCIQHTMVVVRSNQWKLFLCCGQTFQHVFSVRKSFVVHM